MWGQFEDIEGDEVGGVRSNVKGVTTTDHQKKNAKQTEAKSPNFNNKKQIDHVRKLTTHTSVL